MPAGENAVPGKQGFQPTARPPADLDQVDVEPTAAELVPQFFDALDLRRMAMHPPIDPAAFIGKVLARHGAGVRRVPNDRPLPFPMQTADADGIERWVDEHGLLNRADGPAMTRPDGYEAWYSEGHLSRDDGPAVTQPDGSTETWRDGFQYGQ